MNTHSLDQTDPTFLTSVVVSPSYTPRVRDCSALLKLFLDGKLALSAMTTLLLRVRSAAIPFVEQAMETAADLQRRELVALLGRLIRETGADPRPLVSALSCPDRKTGRAAVIALGKFPSLDEKIESQLIALWPAWTEPADRRALVETLGKIGGPRSRSLLESTHFSSQNVLEKTAGLARRRLEQAALRDASSSEQASILLDVPLPKRWPVLLQMRAGLEPFLEREIATLGLGPAQFQPSQSLGILSRAVLDFRSPLETLFRLRTFLDFGFRIALERCHVDDKKLSARLSEALRQPHVQTLLSALTVGPVRYRISAPDLRPSRSVLHAWCQAISEAAPWLHNDPQSSPWQFHVEGVENQATELLLRPKSSIDPRFSYRRVLVPASSHPTLAAALARCLQPKPSDVVWDPFVGSGAELCEAFLLCPRARFVGSDLDKDALHAAKTNVQAAGAKAEFFCADATMQWPLGVSCVLTNPPMGRRVCRGDSVELLERFVAQVGERLPPHGKFCWLNPFPHRIAPIARRFGLQKRQGVPVDMNGFWADLELWQKR